ncbi:MAG: NAD(+)/NADH kinase [Pseudomonadota bacterium]|nr:NAD(+)/NADH kinase [Pseudomonadota bacterium]
MAAFKKIYLFGFEKNNVHTRITSLLNKMGVELVSSANDADVILVLGGDGSMLHSAKQAHQYQVPILGLNLGHRGFLADIEDVEDGMLEQVLEGQFVKETRQVLECVVDGNVYTAINEVMLCKSKPTRMIKYELKIDDVFLYEQTADGIIVCTTTGSSAYALSAGGPIMHPKAAVLGIVPICSNNITSTPLIINDDAVINLTLKIWKDSQAELAIDAQTVVTNPKTLEIRRHKNTVTFLHPHNHDYYKTLKSKLNWEV